VNFENYRSLLFDRDGKVLNLTFNRPQTSNAFDRVMEGEFRRFLLEVSHDPETNVVVLTGAGHHFSAGGDLNQIHEVMEKPYLFFPSMLEAKQIVQLMLDCPKPIIAKINGHAVGLGATIALYCDITLAAEHAKIADPHVLVGFAAGDGGSIIWPQLMGYNRAKEYLFTGEAILAADAERMGLINHCVAADELDGRVSTLAHRIANGAACAIQWTKASINIALKQLAVQAMDASIAYEALSNMTADHREAVTAMMEKRTPDFSGN